MSNDIEDQRDDVREAVRQASALCTATVFSFVQALANALPQYAANGMTDFSADPWWVSMTSYLKGSLSLFSALPGVPARYFSAAADEGEEEVVEEEEQRVLTASEVEELASAAGCLEHVEVRALACLANSRLLCGIVTVFSRACSPTQQSTDPSYSRHSGLLISLQPLAQARYGTGPVVLSRNVLPPGSIKFGTRVP